MRQRSGLTRQEKTSCLFLMMNGNQNSKSSEMSESSKSNLIQELLRDGKCKWLEQNEIEEAWTQPRSFKTLSIHSRTISGYIIESDSVLEMVGPGRGPLGNGNFCALMQEEKKKPKKTTLDVWCTKKKSVWASSRPQETSNDIIIQIKAKNEWPPLIL